MATLPLQPQTRKVSEENQQPGLLDRVIQTTQSAARYLPVMDVEMLIARRDAIRAIITHVLVAGEDYGIIPGTDREKERKPGLLKPGAEKIAAFFGYSVRYEYISKIEDWDGREHGGEPLFYYHVKCILGRDGIDLGEGNGSCNTWESKYRYRSGERTCPQCGKAALLKGKPEYERDSEYKRRGAWICYAKRGGCGAKYYGDAPEIMTQDTARVANPHIHDAINTAQKIADKRAFVAAVLTVTGASQFFTQDTEDGLQGISSDARKPDDREAPTGPGPQVGDDPVELKQTVARFVASEASTRMQYFSQIRVAMKDAGREADYYAALEPFTADGPVDKLPVEDQVKALRAVWLALAKV